MITKILPSYLYVQYADDANLQALVRAQNQQAQDYLDTLNSINLPIYTQAPVSDALLDWVGLGLYGIPRPSLSTVLGGGYLGSFNTGAFNTLAFNAYRLRTPNTFIATTDDVYRRCITWSIYKGDGAQFNVRWLKRRVMRFLLGVNGTDVGTDQTYPISIGFGVGGAVTIRIVGLIRTVTGGSTYNRSAFNRAAFGSITSTSTLLPALANAEVLQDAINSGALPLPFQYTYTVQLT